MVDLFPEAVSLTLEKRLGSEDIVEGQVIPQLSHLAKFVRIQEILCFV